MPRRIHPRRTQTHSKRGRSEKARRKDAEKRRLRNLRTVKAVRDGYLEAA